MLHRQSGRVLPSVFVAIVAMTSPSLAEDAGIATDEKSSQAFKPNEKLEVSIPERSAEVQIDGRLDDPMWHTAARIGNFVEINPGDNVEPKVKTEVLFTYDEHNLYVGYRCYDADPSQIRASITDRDNIFSDDYVGIMIDTFKDEQNGLEFFVNPFGIQGDLRRTRNNEDSSYDTVWHSGGRITDDGWTAEMAIPFRSLRFPDAEEQDWGLHVIRNRPRDSREQISWMQLSRDENCFFCQAGTINGMSGVNQGKNLEILPYVLASDHDGFDDNDVWKDGSPDGRIGFDVKYGLTTNYTMDFTANPDFSQIESDATQIDANNTFALFFPERRPFFLEGASIFNSKINAVYTRSINDPQMAGKLTGKSGRTTVGYIAARDQESPYVVPFEERSEVTTAGKSVSNIVRAKRDILTDSFVGAMLTDRRREDGDSGFDGSNTVGGLDWRLRLGENYGFEGQVLGSYTVEPSDTLISSEFEQKSRFGPNKEYTSEFDGESFGGLAADIAFERSARHFNMWAWYEGYSSTFRAENGFVSRNSLNILGLWTGYNLYFEGSRFLERMQPQFSAGRANNTDGAFKDEWYEPNIWIRFKKQTSFWTGFLFSSERFADRRVGGIRRLAVDLFTEFSKRLSGGAFYRIGNSLVREAEDPRLGRENSLSLWGALRPTSQFQWRVDYNYFRMDELNVDENVYEVFVVRNRLTYQFTPRFFLRLVGEYYSDISGDERGASIDPLLSYKLNPFTVFFAGSSHSLSDNRTPERPNDYNFEQRDRVFFVKFQYLLRV